MSVCWGLTHSWLLSIPVFAISAALELWIRAGKWTEYEQAQHGH